MDFVGDGDHIADAFHDLRCELEAKVHALGANVEENVAGRGDGVASGGANFLKGVKLGGARGSEEIIPGIGAETGDAGKAALKVAKIDSAKQAGETGAKGAQTRDGISAGADTQHQKDRVLRQRTDDWLGNNLIRLAGRVHFFDLDRESFAPEYRILARTVREPWTGRVAGFSRCIQI